MQENEQNEPLNNNINTDFNIAPIPPEEFEWRRNEIDQFCLYLINPPDSKIDKIVIPTKKRDSLSCLEFNQKSRFYLDFSRLKNPLLEDSPELKKKIKRILRDLQSRPFFQRVYIPTSVVLTVSGALFTEVFIMSLVYLIFFSDEAATAGSTFYIGMVILLVASVYTLFSYGEEMYQKFLVNRFLKIDRFLAIMNNRISTEDDFYDRVVCLKSGMAGAWIEVVFLEGETFDDFDLEL